MTIKNPTEIRETTDEITRTVKVAQSFDEINAAKKQLADIRAYVVERRDEYETECGDDGLQSVQKEIYDTGVFIGLKEIEIKRRNQTEQLRALGYKI